MIALSVLFLVTGLVQASRDAPTVDEGPDLVAALVSVERRDLRLNPEHGVLHHVLPGVLPVLLADPLLPETDAYRDGAWFDYTEDVISANDEAGRLDRVLFWFRVVPLLAGLATGWILFALGRRLAGDVGGLLAGGLWLTTPYIVGLSHLGSLDVSFALAVGALVLAIVRDRERPSVGRAAVVAIVLGLALATRHLAIVLVPVAVGFVMVHRWQDRQQLARRLAVALVLPVLVVWGTHRAIDPVPAPGAPAERFEALVGSARSLGPLERLTLSVPMPLEWQAGFAYLAITSDDRPAYLFGDNWEGNRPWFFPVSAAVKLPLTATAAILCGAWMTFRGRWREPVVGAIAVTGGVLAAFLLVQPLALGLRLAVPVLGLAMVAAAPLAALRHRRWGAGLLAVAAAGQLAATFAAHPASLAWTPPPFTNGYRVVSDSSIDFGQALFAVRQAHAEDPFVAISLMTPRGLYEPDDARHIGTSSPDQLVGRVAVGATPLMVTRRDELSWLRAYCPVDVIEGAVLVYDFTMPPDMSPGPSMPAAPCLGEVSRRQD